MRELKSAIVTGATGFIGRALVRRLLLNGVRVYCVVRRGNTSLNSLRLMKGVSVLETVAMDSQSLSEIFKSVGRVDVLFHLAAAGVNPVTQDPTAILDGNVNLLHHLLLAAQTLGLKLFVHTGSCSEYAVPTTTQLITEDHPLRPTSLYGASKAACFVYGTALADSLGIPFVTLRLFGVFGPGESSYRLVPHLIQNLSRGRTVELSPGNQIRDYSYVEDVVDAYLLATRIPNSCSDRVYNICSSRPVSVRQVAETVIALLDKPANLLRWGSLPYRKGEPMWMVGANSRYCRATGWINRTPLETGLMKMIALQAAR